MELPLRSERPQNSILHRERRTLRRHCLAVNLFLGACGLLRSASGNPGGEVVTQGAATFHRQGDTLSITQKTGRAVIDWQQFSNSAGETTRFLQPNSKSSVLNKVVGGERSIIDGRIEANGQVVLVNPNGVTVGPGGVVNTQSFIGSTLDLAPDQFMTGGALSFKGTSTADFTNLGTIRTPGGDAIIVSRQINNAGTIEAPKGTVGLAAGSEVLIQPKGDQRLFIKAGSASGTITHSGTIKAAAAEIKASGNPYSAGINLSGWVTATGTAAKKGSVRINSGGPAKLSGHLKATNVDGTGGSIAVIGSEVHLQGAVVDASGRQGGQVSISGEQAVSVNGSINASGLVSGGTVSITAGDLSLDGRVQATGGTGTGGSIGFKATRFALESAASSVDASGGRLGGSIRQVAGSGSPAPAALPPTRRSERVGRSPSPRRLWS